MENKIGLTNKSKAISIYKWTLRKYLPFSIAYWILLFITFPMIEIMGMIVSSSACKTEKISMWKYYTRDILDVAKIMPGSIFGAVVIGFSAILTIMAFSYMHNKRAVDLFGSFPVSRRTLFFSRYAAVITSCVIPVILIGGLGAGLTLYKPAMIETIKALAFLLLEVIGNVSFIAFISLCCGTVADVIICYGIINVIYPLCVCICYYFPRTIIPGYSAGIMPDTAFTLLSPVAAPFVAIWGEGKILHIVWWIVLSFVLAAGCYILSRKRKAETAQNAFAFNIVEVVVKFAVTFTAGFGVGWIMAYFGGSVSVKAQYMWFAVGLAGGIMVSNVLIHLIFHRGLTRYTKSLKECVIVFLTGIVFLIIVTSGFFGFDMRIPDEGDIKEVSVSVGAEQTFRIDGNNVLEFYTDDKSVISDTINLHEQIKDIVSKNKNVLYPITSSMYTTFNSLDDEEVVIVYKMNNGKKIKRSYAIALDKLKISDNINNLSYNDAQIIDKIPVKYIDYIGIMQRTKGENKYMDIGYDISANKDFDFSKKVIDALKKDIKEHGMYTGKNYSYNFLIDYYNYKYYDSVSFEIKVPETYKNTIEVLSNNGYQNVGYLCLKEKFYYLDYPEFNIKNVNDEKTIYFKVPENWGDGDIQCQQLRYDIVEEDDVDYGEKEEWREMYQMTNADNKATKCEKVSDNIWKYTIKSIGKTDEKVTYDYVMFYQINDEITYTTDVYKLPKNKKKNYLTIDSDDNFICSDSSYTMNTNDKAWDVYNE